MMRRPLVGAEREAYQREYLPLLQRAEDFAERYDGQAGPWLFIDPDLRRELAELDARYWPVPA